MALRERIALIFPGQGAQVVGMGKAFYDAFPIVRETFAEADAIVGRPLTKLIFEGPIEDLTETKNSQIALLTVGVALMRLVKEQGPIFAAAGLSLGEYGALVAADVLSFQDALQLVALRAQYMNDACAQTRGAMAAVLGLNEIHLDEDDVWVANYNCPGQIVITGTPEGIARASEELKEKGAKRVLPLQVSGAFHSPLMRSAQERLKEHIDAVKIHAPTIALVQNVPGGFVTVDQIKKNLVAQVTSSVRWQQGIVAMEEKGVTLYLELGPGRTLSGMNKRIGVKAPTICLESLQDYEEFIHAT